MRQPYASNSVIPRRATPGAGARRVFHSVQVFTNREALAFWRYAFLVFALVFGFVSFAIVASALIFMAAGADAVSDAVIVGVPPISVLLQR
jgi:hypothetical protein